MIVLVLKMLEKLTGAYTKDPDSLIGKLSGGEKRRLNLLRVLMEAPNVLILDVKWSKDFLCVSCA